MKVLVLDFFEFFFTDSKVLLIFQPILYLLDYIKNSNIWIFHGHVSILYFFLLLLSVLVLLPDMIVNFWLILNIVISTFW